MVGSTDACSKLFDDSTLVRNIGSLYLIAPYVVVALVVLGHPDHGIALMLLGLVAGLLGICFMQGLLPLTHSWIPDLVGGAATVLISAAIFLAGNEAALYLPFYVWLIPVIFASRPPRRARLHALAMGLGAAIALILSNVVNGGLVASATNGQLESLLIMVATVAVVGLMTERLVRAIRNRSEDFASAWLSSPAGIGLISEEGTFLAVNPAFATILGRTGQQLIGASVDDVSHPDDISLLRHKLDEVASGEVPISFEKRCLRPDGAIIWSEVTLSKSRLRDCPVFLALVQDLTAVHDANTAAYVATYKDTLTGLANRNALEVALNGHADHNSAGVLFIIGIDRFNVVNDAFGPRWGDKLLIQLGDRLNRISRSDETVARLNGDEFAVLSRSISDNRAASRRAQEIAEIVRAPLQLAGQQRVITVSIGVATLNTGMPAAAVLSDAYNALDSAKKHGRDRYELFQRTSRVERVQRATMESEMKGAIELGHIRPHFQPIHCALTGQLIGFESLARWHHPASGLLQPSTFIPVAEESGLIRKLGDQILRMSISHAAAWRGSTSVSTSLAVNVSPYQLADEQFPATVARYLDELGFPPDALTLELTESALIDIQSDPEPILRHLSILGVKLALDDFGTGASSLSSLRQYNFDSLKIDRSFVAGLPADIASMNLVRASIRLGREFGLTVTAEGVELQAQLEAVRNAGCTHVQGHLFSVPLQAHEVEPYMMRVDAMT